MASTYSGRYRETSAGDGQLQHQHQQTVEPDEETEVARAQTHVADVQGQADGGLDVDELGDHGHQQESHQGAVGERLPVPHRPVRLRVRVVLVGLRLGRIPQQYRHDHAEQQARGGIAQEELRIGGAGQHTADDAAQGSADVHREPEHPEGGEPLLVGRHGVEQHRGRGRPVDLRRHADETDHRDDDRERSEERHDRRQPGGGHGGQHDGPSPADLCRRGSHRRRCRARCPDRTRPARTPRHRRNSRARSGRAR